MHFTAMVLGGLLMATAMAVTGGEAGGSPLDPRGRLHIPIGIANTLDNLKTFVEAEGSFSPGFATYGISFWLYDSDASRLYAPTMEGADCEHGLGGPTGALIPWSAWDVGEVAVRSEVCEVRGPSPEGEAYVVGARVRLINRGHEARRVSLYAALRPLGPAGGPVNRLQARGSALLVDGHAALVAETKPSAAGVATTDTVGEAAMAGGIPKGREAASAEGNCSGALRFDLNLGPAETRILGFICPVLAGRRAVGHRWDGVSEWAQLDLAKPNPAEGGHLQPDPGLAFYRGLKADALFRQAQDYWRDLTGRVTLHLPDPHWAECFAAITGHVAVAMNEGAPDVSVVNYNVFNRDGVYVTNILQKAGRFDLAAEAIDYFIAHPFNGRIYPEADNPGQILWIMGEYWRFTHDRQWLARIYPAARKLAAMIRYYRTTPGPHWVSNTGLDFGDVLPADTRQELEPGRCDGYHPEYTEAFDIAGMRAAALLAIEAGEKADEQEWRDLATTLSISYDARFGARPPAGYGSYCVLWPCRLYPIDRGPAHAAFNDTGAQEPSGWRYFPLATAHQGLLAGNRAAGWKTLEQHLGHEQMRGWYAFDEGGKSGRGGWDHARTTWNGDVAMPHGWAVAEAHLLLRDCLLYDDGERLVLLAGVPEEWFTDLRGMTIEGAPTYFGALSLRWKPGKGRATLTLSGTAAPPAGYLLKLPPGLAARVTADGQPATIAANGDVALPAGTRQATIEFRE